MARILRPQGRRGEVAAEILTDFPGRLTQLATLELYDGSALPRRVRVRSCWISQSHKRQAVFHFEGSDSILDAEKLIGCEVQIPLSERMPLPAGSYYITDLIGCEVYEKDVNAIGFVSDVHFTGEEVAGTPLLAVDSPRGELLIPLAQEICVCVDIPSRRIDVVLPEGLRDLNSSS